ncbi:MAG: hypothetical protein QM813_16965 [Verrucomicrobiota bacterium]
MEGFNPEAFGSNSGSQASFLRQYVPADDDEGVTATFYMKEEVMPFLSQQAGKEIKERRPFIKIVVKGNDKSIVHRPIQEGDKKRFPFSWQQFERGEDQSKKGTALSELFDSDSELVPHYHAMNVFTLEDLAQVSDGNLQLLGAGARENRLRAKEYLAKIKDAGQVASLLARIAELEKKAK